jgi:hypothetical protein
MRWGGSGRVLANVTRFQPSPAGASPTCRVLASAVSPTGTSSETVHGVLRPGVDAREHAAREDRLEVGERVPLAALPLAEETGRSALVLPTAIGQRQRHGAVERPGRKQADHVVVASPRRQREGLTADRRRRLLDLEPLRGTLRWIGR